MKFGIVSLKFCQVSSSYSRFFFFDWMDHLAMYIRTFNRHMFLILHAFAKCKRKMMVNIFDIGSFKNVNRQAYWSHFHIWTVYTQTKVPYIIKAHRRYTNFGDIDKRWWNTHYSMWKRKLNMKSSDLCTRKEEISNGEHKWGMLMFSVDECVPNSKYHTCDALVGFFVIFGLLLLLFSFPSSSSSSLSIFGTFHGPQPISLSIHSIPR